MVAARRGRTVAPQAARLPRAMQMHWALRYERTPYHELPWFSARPNAWLQSCVRAHAIRPRTRVLDVGCGAGTNTLFLARARFRASGVDVAPAAIEAARDRARKAGLSVDFRVGDALRLPYPTGTFGGLFDVGCFATLPVRLRRSYARELARVLRPGGRYVLSWIGREDTRVHGPPHRPSLAEACAAFEPEFLFLRTEHRAGGAEDRTTYQVLLERRGVPQPPPW